MPSSTANHRTSSGAISRRRSRLRQTIWRRVFGASCTTLRTRSRSAELSLRARSMACAIYASAAVHHTMKYPNALRELMRVLRPGGKLVLAETFGNNKLLNAARRWRWKWSGQPDEAGEEIILDDHHLALLRGEMQRVEVIPINLLAMAKRMFRGRFKNRGVRAATATLEGLDSM